MSFRLLFSHHGKDHKISTAETLLHRATNVPSTAQGKNTKINHVTDALRDNNFPSIISNILKRKFFKPRTHTIPSPQELVCMLAAPQEHSNSYAVLPLITQQLTRILRRHDIQVVFNLELCEK